MPVFLKSYHDYDFQKMLNQFVIILSRIYEQLLLKLGKFLRWSYIVNLHREQTHKSK